MREGGKWIVYESTVPQSRKVTLCRFLKKAKKWHYAILRPNFNVKFDDLADVRRLLEQRLGVSYDLGFDYESEKLFCSKMVYDVYRKVFDIEIGSIKTFQQIFEENPESSLSFWNIWFFGKIPWERRTVTPKDQFYDGDLFIIYNWENSRNRWDIPIENKNSTLL